MSKLRMRKPRPLKRRGLFHVPTLKRWVIIQVTSYNTWTTGPRNICSTRTRRATRDKQGVAPRTPGLCSQCSAIELQQLHNHRPSQYSAALFAFDLKTSSCSHMKQEFWADSSFCRNQGVGRYLTVMLASWMPQFRCYEAKIGESEKAQCGWELNPGHLWRMSASSLYFRIIYFQLAWGKMLWASIMIILFWESMS